MRKFTKFSVLLLLFSFMVSDLFSQTGEYNEYVSADGWSGNVAFYREYSNDPQPLIIALHPAGTPEDAMRQMMRSAASQVGAVLACPSGPDGDGTAIMPLVAWCIENYNIDEDKIFLTGYSAGSWPTFSYGFPNYQTFRGLVGIAGGSSQGMTQQAVSSLGIGLICGTQDQMYSSLLQFESQIESMGGNVLFKEKSGVGHTGAYFWSSEFADDWVEIYNFCLDIVFKPGTVSLSAPGNGDEDLEMPVTLEWEEDKAAEEYEVVISDDNGVVDETSRNSNYYIAKQLEPGKMYYWKVRAVNSGGEGVWSYEWRFTTKPEAPTEPAVLLEPANESTDIPKDYTFRWNKIENAIYYHLQILTEDDEVFKEYDNIQEEDEDVNKLVRNMDYSTNFKWRVKGWNSAGETQWSEEWTFTTVPQRPSTKVDLSEPADGTTDMTTFPTLVWNVIDGADYYHLQIRKVDSDDFVLEDSLIVKNDDQSTLISYEITDELLGLTEYEWRVAGTNAGGKGPWSDYFSFTTWDPTDVEETLEFSSFKLYPNPASDYLTIRFGYSLSQENTIEIYNLLGQKLIVQNFVTNSMNLDISNLEIGNYYIKITSGTTQTTQSFTKIK